MQVFSQPVFAFMEESLSFHYPKKSAVMNKVYKVRIPVLGSSHEINVFKLVERTAFVLFTTLVAVIFPFFNDILGIIGAIAFWPLTIYFPFQMHIHRSGIRKWSSRWCFLQAVVVFFFALSLAVLVASMTSVIKDLKMYDPFNSHS
jgi:amino acid permease